LCTSQKKNAKIFLKKGKVVENMKSKGKAVYEKPRSLVLSGLAQGACEAGSTYTPSRCKAGVSAGGNCDNGAYADSSCKTGESAVYTCKQGGEANY
jgi:hypothetical protein